MSLFRKRWESHSHFPLEDRLIGLAAVAVTIYICYRFAEPTIAALGKHGTNAVVRLSAFLLLCIGIQIVWTGFSELQSPSASASLVL
jgi:multiple antibiotic resistance protein